MHTCPNPTDDDTSWLKEIGSNNTFNYQKTERRSAILNIRRNIKLCASTAKRQKGSQTAGVMGENRIYVFCIKRKNRSMVPSKTGDQCTTIIPCAIITMYYHDNVLPFQRYSIKNASSKKCHKIIYRNRRRYEETTNDYNK